MDDYEHEHDQFPPTYDFQDGEEVDHSAFTTNNNRYLSVCFAGGKLGAAYYDQQTQELYLLNDLEELATDLRLIRSLIAQVEPSFVLVNSRQDDRTLKEMKKFCVFTYRGKRQRQESVADENQEDDEVDTDDRSDEEDSGSNTNSDNNRPTLQLLSGATFDYDDAMHRLEDLICPTEANKDEKDIQLSFAVNQDCRSMVRSAGALLKFLDIRRIGVELEEFAVKTPIVAVRTFTLERMLEIDAATFNALQVFARQLHPSAYKAGRSGCFKEGLSLLGLCNKCRSSPGRAELRRWFQRPVMDLEVLGKRHSAVDYFSKDENYQLTLELLRALRGVKNITGIMKRLKSSQESVGDWNALCRIAATFCDELCRIGWILNDMLDLPEMQKQNRFVVKEGVDEELDEKKKYLNQLPAFLTKVAEKEFRALQTYIHECSVLYLPMLGYLVSVPRSAILTGIDVHEIPGLRFVFRSGEIMHYKSETMQGKSFRNYMTPFELDETIGDLKFEIVDLETSVMLRLEEVIARDAPVVFAAVKAVAQLDCVLALSVVARDRNWVKPEMVEEPVLEVGGSWHPLLEEISAGSVVPNPIESGATRNSGKIKVLTGPNASGKSVYLKQVGVVAFLAHVGSFVPAKKAKIGLLDRIFTRIHADDCVLDGISTFCRDLQQMSVALRRSTGNSLVIVDEFGKGTNSDVGLALLVSSLKFWAENGEDCPHVFLCSHFHSIPSLLPQSDFVKYQTMDVLRDGSDLVFLYKLVDGNIKCSYAAYAALAAGLQEKVVERGYNVYLCLKSGKPIKRRADADGGARFKAEYKRYT